MNLDLNKTKNGFVTIDYIPEKPRQDLLNEIWRKREDHLNNDFDQHDLKRTILFDSITHNDNSFLGNYDDETHRIQERKCYATYINFVSLVNELKALTPIYKDYTIINFKCYGMSYDFEKNTYFSMFSSTDIDAFDCHTELIAKPFTDLIEYLKGRENICRELYVYDFNVELLPNKIKSKRQRTHIPKGMRHEVFKRDDYTCCECGATKEDGAKLHIDHIIPVSRGGSDELSNLQTLCADCNLNKSDLIQDIGK